MTDKEQKIREELARLKEETSIGLSEHDNGVEQGRMEIINALSLFLDSMHEKPKECMYSKDNYTDEDRKALCDGCEEDCKYNKKETVNDNCLLNKPSIPDIVDEHFYEMLGEETVSEDNNLRKASEEYLKVLSETPYNNTPITNAQTIVRELITFLDNPSKYNPNHIEEYVSEDLDEAAFNYAEDCKYEGGEKLLCIEHFKVAAEWQKANLWKPADGNKLPEYDREVIAILDYDFGHYKVVYAHRPNPNGWNGTNIDTGEKEHFEPAIYDKGGWNQPHVLYLLDARLPYEKIKQ